MNVLTREKKQSFNLYLSIYLYDLYVVSISKISNLLYMNNICLICMYIIYQLPSNILMKYEYLFRHPQCLAIYIPINLASWNVQESFSLGAFYHAPHKVRCVMHLESTVFQNPVDQVAGWMILFGLFFFFRLWNPSLPPLQPSLPSPPPQHTKKRK